MTVVQHRAEPSARLAAIHRTRVDLLPYAFIAPIVLLLLAISFYPTLYAV
jgi:hypothetical protein